MKFSVIIATLLRPSLRDTLIALENQTLKLDKDFEIIVWAGERNEYEARNKASRVATGDILAFTDDDAYPAENWLENAEKYFRNGNGNEDKNEGIAILSGPVEGDVFGTGRIRVSKPGWYIGCNMMVRKDVFEKEGGFEVDWQLNPCPKGWRSDTDLGFRIEDKYGKSSSAHAEDVLVYHPGRMQSSWDPRVERIFYLRHREKCIERFLPVDPRLCQFILKEGIEKDPAVINKTIELLRGFESQYNVKFLEGIQINRSG